MCIVRTLVASNPAQSVVLYVAQPMVVSLPLVLLSIPVFVPVNTAPVNVIRGFAPA